MITVDKKDGHKLKISHVIHETTNRQLDMFIFIPGELGLNSNIITEEEFYHNAIHGKRTYFSDINHLPLVHSRLASRGKLSIEQYRLSLSLYAYQYALALEKTTQQLLSDSSESKQEDIEEAAQLAVRILKRLRRNIPTDKKLLKYYENIDNYLSWFTEQRFLQLIAHLPRGAEYNEIKPQLLEICQKEAQHRKDNNYNSARAMQDPTRMSNKMRLLRRLIEYPVTMAEKTIELGKNTRKIVTGAAAGIVMIFVTLMLIKARGMLGDITASFILVLSIIYAAREVFKDDLKTMLWRWMRKGKARWRKQFFDANTGHVIGRQLEWLEFVNYDSLADVIRKTRKHNVSHREETILHYKSTTRMSPTKFLSGYEQTRESIILDLRSVAALMEKGSQRLYQLNDGQVTKESVEKRHLINLITQETDEDKTVRIQRWKIIMSRSKIVDIEAIITPEPKKSKPTQAINVTNP
ncbi:hypothetical protein C9J21_03890 [Photobacterium phosphoreum]|uniref:Uncharacterized protein n=1 Tax=Photobacterium phosphoreum TaxID=659 RepID=A0A2T3PPD0_PHOPO|nr:hypothetical protein [Photobacterium phosphoreum]PSU24814.1 hypothetical protein CTM96_11325 [Photobacterium phosphoreum]PSU38013.1 hypothetical protein CTM97_19720 [Photobacterium phosphoreum]PSU51829.1 hypothetical protein C9J18_11840 [Photobacterium phosphoreum]PSU70451.1 hypothetical protein C9J22_10745 [Photobacterium phosphoreum]PSW34497.1 hypothetical protein C9J21_03890 [Photobacterium phosphoreum]